MCYEGSGLMDWRCFAPKRLGDRSATAELIMATAASKAALGHRMLFDELRQAQVGGTPLCIDARAVKNGSEMDKVSREIKFMAAHYDVLRQAETAGAIKLTKAHTLANLVDIRPKGQA